jgi:S-adenosylmethionine:tRNA ribosyltransferase-isomerase
VRLSEFDYELPPERIAQEPAAVRDLARLFVHAIGADRSEHARVRDLPRFLRPGDLLVVNDTRVLAARLFARRASGGQVELFFVEPGSADTLVWKVLVHPARKLRAGELLALEGGVVARMVERERLSGGAPAPEWLVRLEDSAGAPLDPHAVFERVGHVPLPPYIARSDAALDRERYQTVYAERPGAVAAPTAGLHFTPELLARLEQHGVRRVSITLHVGPGTFRPIKTDEIDAHRMHAERFEIPEAAVAAVRAARERGGRVVAVGTTCVRALESAAGETGELRALRGATELFLRPGQRFRVVDGLLTNFHLPRSTLLVLVSAFAGRERVLRLYREAIEQGYRFYSYGDAMLFLP